ncbi:hypothetical protein KUCAC02_036135 [Chaenocephalus aceratus]|nr:hypothetical protein KUCAC02_036135 [Chaenocephalus aceratus]
MLLSGVRSDSCSHLLHDDITREALRQTADVVRKLPRLIGWLELRDLMDVYLRSVFSRPAVKKLLLPEYKALLYRIQHTLQLCVSSPTPSKWYKAIKKMEKKIKKKRRDERALKAFISSGVSFRGTPVSMALSAMLLLEAHRPQTHHAHIMIQRHRQLYKQTPVCLLVFLGAALVSGKPCLYIGEHLKESHEYISNVLSLKGQDVGLDPLFSDVIRSNSSLQIKINLINATLEVYRRIFSSILRQDNQGLLENLSETDRKKVTKEVEVLEHKIEYLTKTLGHVNHDKENILSKLQKIQVDDPLVQKKALAEFKEVFQAANVIICPGC